MTNGTTVNGLVTSGTGSGGLVTSGTAAGVWWRLGRQWISGDEWAGSERSDDECDGSGRSGRSVSNAITLLLSYSIEANLCIVYVMSVNLI